MKKRFWMKVYLLLFVTIGAILALGYCFTLSWNLTPSLPLGIWYQAEKAGVSNLKGKVVSICPPDTPLFRDARERRILKRGRCPGGFAPLLKRVVGVAGDVIEVNGLIKVNGMIVSHSSVIKEVATFYKTGPLVKKLVAGELWVMGDTDDSFDSRYFWGASSEWVIGVMRLFGDLQMFK